MDASTVKIEEKKARVIEAISAFKQQHPKWSPSDDFLARETQLPQREVKYLIRQLEEEDVIGVVGSWPRSLWIKETDKTMSGAIQKTKEKEVLTTATHSTPTRPAQKRVYKLTGNSKRMPLERRARQIAEAIMRMKESGETVYVKSLSTEVFGHAQTGHMSVLINKMLKKGWVTHGKRKWGDITLTELGLSRLLGIHPVAPAPEVAVPQDLPVQAREEAFEAAGPDDEDASDEREPTPLGEPDPQEQQEQAQERIAMELPQGNVPASTVAKLIMNVAAQAADEAVARMAQIDLSRVDEAALVYELIVRGYTVKR